MLRQIKKPMTWIMIGFLMLISLIWVQNQTLKRLDRSFDKHDVYRFSSGRIWDYRNMYEQLSEKEETALKLLTETQHQIFIAHQNNDVEELTRQISLFNLLAVRQSTDRTNAFDKFVYERRLKPIWDQLNLDMSYNDIVFPKDITADPFRMYIISKLYSEFYGNGIEPKYADDVDIITYTVMYYDVVLPYMGIVISIFVTYASINREVNSGVVKLLLSQTVSRKRYYLMKWLSNLTQVLIIMLVPYLLMSLILILTNGFSSTSYPMFAVKSRSLFEPYFNVPVRNMVESVSMVPADEALIFHQQTIFLTIEMFSKRALLIFICFVSFLVSTIQWVSACVKDEILSFSLSAIIIAMLYGLRKLGHYFISYNVFPFEIAKTVLGINDITVHGSVLLFLIGTVGMMFFGTTYFNKKSL